MADFPAALPNIPNPGSTLGTTGAATDHATIHTRIEEEIYAVAARLGITSVAAMTLATSVTAYTTGHLAPASTLTAGLVVTRGMVTNGTGGVVAAGTAIAQLSSSLHWPIGGTVTFTSTYTVGAVPTVIRLFVNTTGQILVDQSWPNGSLLNIGGFVWWL